MPIDVDSSSIAAASHRQRFVSNLTVFAWLIAVPLVLISIDIAYAVGGLLDIFDEKPIIFTVTHEQSASSYFGYCLWMVIAIALIIAWLRHSAPIFLGLAGVALLLGCDDYFELHERVGGSLRNTIPTVMGLEGKDIGELVGWAIYAALILPVLVLTGKRSSVAQRTWGLLFFGLLMLLAFFGIGVDLLHSFIAAQDFGQMKKYLAYASGVIEDGGEAIVISVLAGFAVMVARLRTLPAVRFSGRRVMPIHD